eukprot:CAMPEP_0118973418 /NCGR_PEP_ID=MMETSP1173-20130426/10073_1 /TAXON_ID=1034831 /ORGANISM="Rhizochromulina marina cf, Strain CCMP1243" /LENGTH=205 /DNA_ID=CAMNT_0006923071 /DNA_START=106 /DNA_END=720 /DNA_ORIENTATION=+
MANQPNVPAFPASRLPLALGSPRAQGEGEPELMPDTTEISMLQDYRFLGSVNAKLRGPCQYADIAPKTAPVIANTHWATSGRNWFTRPGAPVESSTWKSDNDLVAFMTKDEQRQASKLWGRLQFVEAKHELDKAQRIREDIATFYAVAALRSHPLGPEEAKLEEQHQEDTFRFLQQRRVAEQCEHERDARVAAHGAEILESPCCS